MAVVTIQTKEANAKSTVTSVLPMDSFSVKARVAVELGQQSENAISYLNRNTSTAPVHPQDRPGTALPRDQAKTGAICEIVVRDTGFNIGAVLWRAVGLLFEGIDPSGGQRLDCWYGFGVMKCVCMSGSRKRLGHSRYCFLVEENTSCSCQASSRASLALEG